MNVVKTTICSFVIIVCFILNASAHENSIGHRVCKRECVSRYCPLEKDLCQRAYNKCVPKCLSRHDDSGLLYASKMKQ